MHTRLRVQRNQVALHFRFRRWHDSSTNKNEGMHMNLNLLATAGLVMIAYFTWSYYKLQARAAAKTAPIKVDPTIRVTRFDDIDDYHPGLIA